MDQLVREEKIKQLLHHSSGQESQIGSEPWRVASSRPPLGTLNIIFTAPRRTSYYPSRIMYVALLSAKDSNFEPNRAKVSIQLALNFSDKDKVGTIQPHDDALVITLRIEGV